MNRKILIVLFFLNGLTGCASGTLGEEPSPAEVTERSWGLSEWFIAEGAYLYGQGWTTDDVIAYLTPKGFYIQSEIDPVISRYPQITRCGLFVAQGAHSIGTGTDCIARRQGEDSRWYEIWRSSVGSRHGSEQKFFYASANDLHGRRTIEYQSRGFQMQHTFDSGYTLNFPVNADTVSLLDPHLSPKAFAGTPLANKRAVWRNGQWHIE